MKTRELLTCDIKVFGSKIDKIKPKELHQHIDRIATSLGEQDPKAMMEAVIAGVFDHGLPEDSRDEMGRVFDAVAGRIPATSANMDQFLRLVALCLAWLRKIVTQEARRQVQAQWHQSHGHDQHHCEDPHCHAHHTPEDGQESQPEPGPSTLAAAIRSDLT
jgi:hypothetical protein